MANRLFQSVIQQLKEAIDRTIGVIDESGTVIACSELGKIGENVNIDFMNASVSDTFTFGNATYKAIGSTQVGEYYVFVNGVDPIAEKNCTILSISFSNIKFYYDEKYDRGNFIKNVILDNILPGDIYLKTRELGFNNEVSRCAILIRTQERAEVSISESIQALFPDKNKDYVISVATQIKDCIIAELKAKIEELAIHS